MPKELLFLLHYVCMRLVKYKREKERLSSGRKIQGKVIYISHVICISLSGLCIKRKSHDNKNILRNMMN